MSQKYILGRRAQTRTTVIRYSVWIGILLLLLAVLQVSFFPRFRLLGGIPDLMMIAVLCLSFFSGRYMGAITGIAAGFLIDAIGSTGIVILPLCYLFLGYVVGHYAKILGHANYPSYLVYLAVSLLYRALITVLLACMSYSSVNLIKILIYSVLPELLVTAIAGCILYFPLKIFCMFLENKRKRES